MLQVRQRTEIWKTIQKFIKYRNSSYYLLNIIKLELLILINDTSFIYQSLSADDMTPGRKHYVESYVRQRRFVYSVAL